MNMAVRVIFFYQPGCMGCMEQTPINAEVAKALNISIEEIDATKNQDSVREFSLKVTPTIIIKSDTAVLERFEGVVHTEQLLAAIKKYL